MTEGMTEAAMQNEQDHGPGQNIHTASLPQQCSAHTAAVRARQRRSPAAAAGQSSQAGPALYSHILAVITQGRQRSATCSHTSGGWPCRQAANQHWSALTIGHPFHVAPALVKSYQATAQRKALKQDHPVDDVATRQEQLRVTSSKPNQRHRGKVIVVTAHCQTSIA